MVDVQPIQGQRIDPLAGYKFKVFLGINEVAGFSKVTGLETEFDVVEYREGHDPITPRKYPGLMKFADITLERGLSPDRALQKWHEQIAEIGASGNLAPDGVPDPEYRRDIFIEQYSKASEEPTMVWRLLKAWPKKLADGDLDAMSSDIMVESCEICHEGLVRISGIGGSGVNRARNFSGLSS